MIFARARILIVEDNPSELEAFRKLLAREGKFQLDTADNAIDGIRLAKTHVPDLIISDYNMPEMNGFEFCRRMKQDPRTAGVMFVVVTAFHDTELKVEGLNIGIDDYLTKPVEAAELFAKVRSMLRIKNLHDRLRKEKLDLEEVHEGLRVSFGQLQNVLLEMINNSLPGAAVRGRRLADACFRLAELLHVPHRFTGDLGSAAMLLECGKLFQGSDSRAVDLNDLPSDNWNYVRGSHAILSRVDRLSDSADIIIGIFENWDGSGHPAGQSGGQIPLRSRILRILVDFFHHLRRERLRGNPIDPYKTMEVLAKDSGIAYDPAVVANLRTMVNDATNTQWLETNYRIPVSSLTNGMVLAEDLFTHNGVKLISEGATVTDALLETILKEHRGEPIVDGALVNY